MLPLFLDFEFDGVCKIFLNTSAVLGFYCFSFNKSLIFNPCLLRHSWITNTQFLFRSIHFNLRRLILIHYAFESIENYVSSICRLWIILWLVNLDFACNWRLRSPRWWLGFDSFHAVALLKWEEIRVDRQSLFRFWFCRHLLLILSLSTYLRRSQPSPREIFFTLDDVLMRFRYNRGHSTFRWKVNGFT